MHYVNDEKWNPPPLNPVDFFFKNDNLPIGEYNEEKNLV